LHNPEKIPYLERCKRTKLYRYQRRVPEYAQKIIGKKTWDQSLKTRDYVEAVDRARAKTAEHSALLERLKTPAKREKYQSDKEEEFAAMVVRMRPGMQRRIGDDGKLLEVPPMDRDPGTWRTAPDTMKHARTLPPKQELRQLAYHLATAFDDRKTIDLLNDGSPLGDALVDVMRPTRPTDPTDAAMYDAFKTALGARVNELGGSLLVNPDHTLTAFHEKIAEIRNTKPATIANHKVTTAKFNAFLREKKGMDYEPSIASITDTLLHEYLDHLLDDPNVGNGSIHKYFDGMKSVFNHAIRRKKIPGLIVNPVDFVEMPATQPVEKSMYLPFSKTEIVRLWDEVQEQWGPHNTRSKLAEGRRAAFLMAFRVLLWSGLRPVEFFWLRDHGEVTPDYIYAERVKTDVPRYIPVSDHISDFHKFVRNGGFDACIFNGTFRGEQYGKYNAEKLKEAMRRSFSDIRKQVGIKDKRKVLYSTKDTLMQRLRGVKGYNTYMEVVVTGHVRKMEKGRHYGGILGDDEKVRAKVKKGLDRVTYW